MDSLAFLGADSGDKWEPLYVLAGDEDFLKRQVLLTIRSRLFGPDGDDFGLSTYFGPECDFARISSELLTLPFLAKYRVIVIENADPFVTAHRAALEKYAAHPAATAILVLAVKSWAANTRLARLVDNARTIVCKAPPTYKLPEWCIKWASACHGKTLANSAARLMVDLIGPEMGQLDQELSKLAIYVGSRKSIDIADVDKLVGQSRVENTFKIFDFIASGKPGEALSLLERLFDHGEDPLALLGAFSYQLRRLAQVHRLVQQGIPVSRALDQIAVQPFARQGIENQLRYLGSIRADSLYSWLLEADLGLKGASQMPPRLVLERMVARLVKPSI